jgi:hypothetical protein
VADSPGRADRDDAVDARGDLVLQQAGEGGFIDAIVAEGSDEGGIGAHARGGGREGMAWGR